MRIATILGAFLALWLAGGPSFGGEPAPGDDLDALLSQMSDADVTKATLAAVKLVDLQRAPETPPDVVERIRGMIRATLTGTEGARETRIVLLKVLVDKQEKAFVPEIVHFACFGDAFALEPAVNALRDLKDDSVPQRFIAFGEDASNPGPARARAIRALNHLKAFHAIPSLVQRRGEDSDEIAMAAQQSLEGILGYPFARDAKGWSAWWEKNAGRPETEILREAIRRLQEEAPNLLDGKALAPNLKGLGSGIKSVRLQALQNLLALRDPAAIDEILRYIEQEPYGELRAKAVEVLGELAKTEGALQNRKHAEVAAKLIGLLGRETQERVLKVEIEVLGKIGRVEGMNLVKPLIPFLASRDAEIRSLSAQSLGKIDGEEAREAVPILCGLLTSAAEASAVKRDAANALGQIRDPAGVPALVLGLGDGDANVRWSCANSLGNIQDPEAVDPLVKAMAIEKEGRVLEVLVKALRSIRAPRAAEALAGLLLRKPDLAEKAVEAILHLAEADAAAVLRAADALVEGGDARAAVGLLQAHVARLKDRDPLPFRVKAVECLEKGQLWADAAAALVDLVVERPADASLWDHLLRTLGQIEDPQIRGERVAAAMARLPEKAREFWEGPVHDLAQKLQGQEALFADGLRRGFASSVKAPEPLFLALVSLVESADGKVSRAAHGLLNAWTGQNAPALAEAAPKAERDQAAAEWRKWIAANKASFPFSKG